MKAYANCPVCNEVHLKYLFFFVIDHGLLKAFVIKVARLQTKGNIVKELAVLILLRIEEEPKIVDYIIE